VALGSFSVSISSANAIGRPSWAITESKRKLRSADELDAMFCGGSRDELAIMAAFLNLLVSRL
jgi:hypothetical protein